MPGRLLQKDAVSKGGQEVGHAGKIADIEKGTDRKSFPAETKGHMVSCVVCLVLIIFNSRRTSWDQLTTSTEIPLYKQYQLSDC